MYRCQHLCIGHEICDVGEEGICDIARVRSYKREEYNCICTAVSSPSTHGMPALACLLAPGVAGGFEFKPSRLLLAAKSPAQIVITSASAPPCLKRDNHVPEAATYTCRSTSHTATRSLAARHSSLLLLIFLIKALFL